MPGFSSKPDHLSRDAMKPAAWVERRSQQIWEQLASDPLAREWGGLRVEARIEAENEYDRLRGERR